MSETTTAPAAPAPAAPESSPPAISQPALTISEAGRLLRQHRQDSRANAAGDAQAPQQGAQPAAPAESTPAPQQPASGLSAMERSLGLTEGLTPAASPVAAGDAAPGATPSAEPALSIDGAQYTHAQLREAVSKAADYTRKTQQLAEQARALQQQQASLETVLPFLQPELAKLAEIVNTPIAEPDMSLIQTDPQRYLMERAQYERALKEQQRLASIQGVQQAAQARFFEQQVAKANEQLTAEYPWWADPVERSRAQQEIVAWATTKGGLTHQQLSMVSEAAYLKALMKAATFDKMMSGARTAAPIATVSATPTRGAAPPPPATERVQQAMEAFDARPTFRTGAALLTAQRANGSARRR